MSSDNEVIKGKVPGQDGMPTADQVQQMGADGDFVLWFDAETNQMFINGRIAINGDLNFLSAGPDDRTVNYAGQGTIMPLKVDDQVATVQAQIKTSLVPRNMDGTTANSYPDTNLLGIVTEYKITIDPSDGSITVYAGLYTQDLFEANASSIERVTVVGSVVANRTKFLQEGADTPRIIQVPGLGAAWTDLMRMIGAVGPGGIAGTVSFRELGI